MQPVAPPELAGWANFYVIVGSAAGALTGLQFVTMTLIAQLEAASSGREISAFGTPTVAHFCFALLVSAMMTAPWHSLLTVSLCLAVLGFGGAAYAVRIIWHARKTRYRPDAEDWFWYVVLPLIAYLGIATGGLFLWRLPVPCLFGIALTTLLLLLIGIHNSWDTVTYVAIKHGRSSKQQDRASTSASTADTR